MPPYYRMCRVYTISLLPCVYRVYILVYPGVWERCTFLVYTRVCERCTSPVYTRVCEKCTSLGIPGCVRSVHPWVYPGVGEVLLLGYTPVCERYSSLVYPRVCEKCTHCWYTRVWEVYTFPFHCWVYSLVIVHHCFL